MLRSGAMSVPRDRAAARRALLERVDAIRDVLADGAELAEAAGPLPPSTVAALYDSGLLGLKLPATLGGAEADPLTQMDVIEAVAAIDGSAAWCLMVGATTLARPRCPARRGSTRVRRRRAPRAAGVIAPAGGLSPRRAGAASPAAGRSRAACATRSGIGAMARVARRRRHRRAALRGLPRRLGHRARYTGAWPASGHRQRYESRHRAVRARELHVGLATACPRRAGTLYRLGLPAFGPRARRLRHRRRAARARRRRRVRGGHARGCPCPPGGRPPGLRARSAAPPGPCGPWGSLRAWTWSRYRPYPCRADAGRERPAPTATRRSRRPPRRPARGAPGDPLSGLRVPRRAPPQHFVGFRCALRRSRRE